MRRKKILVGFLAGFFSVAIAQQTHLYFEPNQPFKKAQQLYLTETYLAAQNEFEDILSNPKSELQTLEASEFYAALTGIINNQEGAEERLAAFDNKYPMSVYSRSADWKLGSYYLRKGDFDKAYQYLSQGDLNALPQRKQEEYQFKLGYIHFVKGDNSKALSLLEPLTESKKFGDESSYYTGHIYYSERDFDKAFTYFNALKTNNPEYEIKVLPYLVQIEFNNGEYDQAITDGKDLLNQSNDKFIRSEVSKIIGESYFKQKKYDEAIPYLEDYDGEMTNADYYQLGYAYYQKGDFDKAIGLFNKIVGETNPLAQTAYYQLGNAYLQTDAKQEALTAYQAASAMDFNSTIKENAGYNYAKLSYEIGNPFEGTPQVLQSFLNNYANSSHKSEITDLLIDSYLSSGNYESALSVLGKITNKNAKQNQAEQQAAFLFGTDLFTQGKFNEAIPVLEKAKNNSADSDIQVRATYWLGESLYRTGHYNKALNHFIAFKNSPIEAAEKDVVDYNLGYTYLKLKQYNKAATAFKNYAELNPQSDFTSDAKLRLADSYVGNQNTNAALAVYDDLLNESDSEEAAYNRAIVLGITGNTDEKIDALERFIKQYPDSNYQDRARLELVNAYLLEDNNVKAEQHLDKLIRTGNDEMVARARIKKGLMYSNKDDSESALREYKRVADDYPNTELALQAIENAKQIYISKGNISGFENWASNIDYYQIDKNELEGLAFEATETAFNSHNYSVAITKLKSFIQKYPNSGYQHTANYELGESYYQQSDLNSAIDPFTVVAKSNHPKKEDALLRLSQIYLTQDKKTNALLALEALEKTSTNPSYTGFAQIHLMRLYSETGEHSKALQMANLVSANDKNEAAIKEEAKIISARSLFTQKKYKQAKTIYKGLEYANSSAVKAEAFYYKAYFLNQDKKYSDSNNVVFDLASKYSSQQYWGSKALVIMADNYYHLDDIYQATYTLESVIKNYPEYEDIVTEAKTLLRKIKK